MDRATHPGRVRIRRVRLTPLGRAGDLGLTTSPRARDPVLTSPPILRRSVLALVAVAWASTGCGGGEEVPPGTLDRDTFVEIMVELRMAALEQPDAALAPTDRARILQDHDVTEDDLIAFARVHGDDPSFMAEVWREIEQGLNVPIDSAGAEAGS